MKAALVFPGQGSQFVGMGKELYDTSSDAKAIFDQADEITNNGLKSVIFNGPEEKLMSTAYCQPAIVTMSVAALKVLESKDEYKDLEIAFTAGHSLGEYSALVASEALSFEDTIRLVQKRAAFMEEAATQNPGKMAAVMGLDQDQIVAICKKTGAEVANYNSLQQIVITGKAEAVEAAVPLFKEAGARNVVVLAVSGGFHSSLMQSAAEKFETELANFIFNTPKVPLISNVDAEPTTDPAIISANLAKQITSSVQWVKTIQYIAGAGVTNFYEAGPNKVLKGLLRRIDKSLTVTNV